MRRRAEREKGKRRDGGEKRTGRGEKVKLVEGENEGRRGVASALALAALFAGAVSGAINSSCDVDGLVIRENPFRARPVGDDNGVPEHVPAPRQLAEVPAGADPKQAFLSDGRRAVVSEQGNGLRVLLFETGDNANEPASVDIDGPYRNPSITRAGNFILVCVENADTNGVEYVQINPDTMQALPFKQMNVGRELGEGSSFVSPSVAAVPNGGNVIVFYEQVPVQQQEGGLPTYRRQLHLVVPEKRGDVQQHVLIDADAFVSREPTISPAEIVVATDNNDVIVGWFREVDGQPVIEWVVGGFGEPQPVALGQEDAPPSDFLVKSRARFIAQEGVRDLALAQNAGGLQATYTTDQGAIVSRLFVREPAEGGLARQHPDDNAEPQVLLAAPPPGPVGAESTLDSQWNLGGAHGGGDEIGVTFMASCGQLAPERQCLRLCVVGTNGLNEGCIPLTDVDDPSVAGPTDLAANGGHYYVLVSTVPGPGREQPGGRQAVLSVGPVDMVGRAAQVGFTDAGVGN